MYIERVQVKNFRSIHDADITLDETTAFVGRNGAGKSTLLYALAAFYNTAATFSAHDYYAHVMMDTEIRIRVTFGGLRSIEIAEFGEYVQDGKLSVTKVITSGGHRYVGSSMQIPLFAELRKLKATERRQKLKAETDAGKLPEFPTIPAADAGVHAAMDAYEKDHPELTSLVEKESAFFGSANVGGGKLDKFTKFVMVPAVRDAGGEMEKRGAILQLLDLIVTRSIASRKEFTEFKASFEQKAKELYSKENLPELTKLGEMITNRLRRYAPEAALEIDFSELKAPAIPIPEAVVGVIEDDFKVPIRYTGHGLQRALVVALLEQLSQTQQVVASTPSDPGATGPEGPANPAGVMAHVPDVVLAIEEPELYLHPARSRFLAKILRSLGARPTDPNAPVNQILYVTHSPYFVDVEYFDQVRMCRKYSGDKDKPSKTGFAMFTRGQAAKKLASILGADPATFTARSFVTRAVPVLNSIVNEGLFASVAVVVEGDSDVAALWAMQARLKQRWDEKGIVVIAAGGKTNIDRPVVVFSGLGIPTFFVFDGDKGVKQVKDAPKSNRLLLTLAGENPTDFPPTECWARAAAFETDIETYLQSVVGADYIAMRDKCAADCGHDRPSKAMKSSEVMALFLDRAQEAKKEFKALEKIVLRVSAMAEGK